MENKKNVKPNFFHTFSNSRFRKKKEKREMKKKKGK